MKLENDADNLNQIVKGRYEKKTRNSVLFLDELPIATKYEDSKVVSVDVKKWRFQQILASHPWGIPSLKFIEIYNSAFNRDIGAEMDEMGFHNFPEMINSMKDIFTVQQPDDVTAIIFPNYSDDLILHDARYGHEFISKPPGSKSPKRCQTKVPNVIDHEALIGLAMLNRDQEFPDDVVLAGEEYRDLMLPASLANVEGTRGVHQVTLIGASNPGHFFVHIKGNVAGRLLIEINQHFRALRAPTDTHLVPDEFIYLGFPCVAYMDEDDSWERCAIISRSSSKANKVLVEMVDYGGIRTVNRMHLHLMPKRFLETPKQAICISLAGLIPKAVRFSSTSTRRLLCFSNRNYILDCLFLDPTKDSYFVEGEDSTIINVENYSIKTTEITKITKDNQEVKQKKRKFRQRTHYEAMICDRNHEFLDLYLDYVLSIETYCKKDPSRVAEIEELREKFQVALNKIPRPENPFYKENGLYM